MKDKNDIIMNEVDLRESPDWVIYDLCAAYGIPKRPIDDMIGMLLEAMWN